MVQPSFRVATPEEAAWYTRRLYPLQDRIFGIAGGYDDRLVLTGGTALARLYLDHRYSDDIDFFTLQPQAGRLGRDLGNALLQAGFSVDPVQATPDFFRGNVSDGITRIQVDVAPDAARVVPPARSALGVFAHDLRDIAANKISAYENRAEVKDAVDLFYLSQAEPWSEMFADAEIKRVPIAYEDLQHFLLQPLSGEALLTREILSDTFDAFVATLRAEIAAEIKKKVLAATLQIAEISSSLLWDTPFEDRNINDRTRPVLARRAKDLPLPQRIALLEAVRK
ncbi:MAG: nucleotidyl transferase AbiEii/AbiGii toxin family protein [Candidatus Velthaea sp.]